jgi:hypothetical protein
MDNQAQPVETYIIKYGSGLSLQPHEMELHIYVSDTQDPNISPMAKSFKLAKDCTVYKMACETNAYELPVRVGVMLNTKRPKEHIELFMKDPYNYLVKLGIFRMDHHGIEYTQAQPLAVPKQEFQSYFSPPMTSPGDVDPFVASIGAIFTSPFLLANAVVDRVKGAPERLPDCKPLCGEKFTDRPKYLVSTHGMAWPLVGHGIGPGLGAGLAGGMMIGALGAGAMMTNAHYHKCEGHPVIIVNPKDK